MRRALSWLANGTVLAILGLAIVAILIFYVGPIISIGSWVPLESVGVRIGLIAVIVATWLGVRAWRWWRARRTNAALLNQLTKDDAAAAAPAEAAPGTAEVEELRNRFKSAIGTLKKSRAAGGRTGVFALFGRYYVYQMPWYVFIGAPGSGKTTALVNSGLEFPLADQFGKAAIRGVGGTRNCDWWFSNQAVLLDTAGRYTTQESNQALDKAEWDGFLGLLRKYRPRAPINGVLLTVSVADLLGAGDEERARQVSAIRHRLAELYERLAVRFPIYVVVTKTDLLGGFNEYFERLTSNERAQVWGFTFPHGDGADAPQNLLEGFRTEYALLQKRLEDALPDLLQSEPDVARRALVYAFTQQFAGLRDVLEPFLATLFTESKFAAPPLVRGVYFTSGTQEGTPFDRVLGSIQRRFGVEARVQAATAAQGTGKSYFLRGLLQDLVFAESHLVSRNPARDKRQRILGAVGVATLAVALIGAAIAWTVSYSSNRGYLAEITPKAEALAKRVQGLPTSADDEVLALLPVLDEARTLAASASFDVDAPPLRYRFGLYQGRKVQSAAVAAYSRLLDDLLLPRIAQRIANLLHDAPPDDLEATYARLKAYLMLHDAEQYRSEFVIAAVTADWEATLGSRLTPESKQRIDGHLRRLFEGQVRLSPLARDDALVKQARERLARYSSAQRIYGQVKALVAERLGTTPEFTLVGAAGPESKSVFTRVSGASLDQGVPALFTREGYRAFQERLDDRRLLLQLDETWVVGRPERSVAGKAADLFDERLLTDLRTQYLDEYRITWEKFLADLRLLPTSTLDESIQLLRYLSAPDSPFTKFVKAVADETALSETGKQGVGVADRAAEAAKKAGATAMQRVFGSTLVPRGGAASASTVAGQIEKVRVDDYFEAWRRLAGPGPGGGESLKLLINEAYTGLQATQSAIRGGNVPPPSDTAVKLRAEAARLPVPLRGMLDSVATTSSSLATSAVRSNIGAQLDADVGVFCRKAVAGRYPLRRDAALEVTPDDFARLFAAGGMLDDFFQKNLASLVDTSTRPWSYRKQMDGRSVGSSASLVSFQQAAVIREAFFRGGGRSPQVRVEMKPVQMDASITGLTLDVDGQTLRYAHGPQVPTTITWPGSKGTNQVRLQLLPPGAGTSGIVEEGPWALHRLFGRARLAPGSSPERFTAELTVGGRSATFEVYVGSVLNPFRLPELEQFNCPGRL